MPISFSAHEDGDDGDEHTSRLPGTSASAPGGLVVFRKPGASTPATTNDNNGASGDARQTSRLGLDRLAEQKRAERRQQAEEEERRRQYRHHKPPDTPSDGTLTDYVRANIERSVCTFSCFAT